MKQVILFCNFVCVYANGCIQGTVWIELDKRESTPHVVVEGVQAPYVSRGVCSGW